MPEQVLGLADLDHHTILIVGVGREGLALARRLQQRAAPPVIIGVDTADNDHVAAWRQELGDGATLEILDVASPSALEQVGLATIAVMSPGIPASGALYGFIQDLGIPMTSGSALFVADYGSSMVGVTGSKGKSTTTTVIHQLLVASGSQASLGGNMGIPLQGIDPQDRCVAEFSSYQCHYLQASPDVVVLTALFPEHLDWHGSQENYFRDKLSILANQPRVVIANGEDLTLRHELTKRYPEQEITWVGTGEMWHLEPDGADSWLVKGDQKLFHTGSSQVIGSHNHLNMLLALAGAEATGALDDAIISATLASFTPLPHRLEKISDPSGVIFVNDSLATNPQAAGAALGSLSSPEMVWLVGGTDRGVDYQVLIDQVVATKPAHILGLPESGAHLVEQFEQALEAAGVSDSVHCEVVESMMSAITRARQLAGPGDIVLLSPGAPSFGQYRDYQHRAEDFLHCITATIPKETP